MRFYKLYVLGAISNWLATRLDSMRGPRAHLVANYPQSCQEKKIILSTTKNTLTERA